MLEIGRARPTDITDVKRIEIDTELSSWSENDYHLEINREDSLFFVAKNGQRVTGFILARLIMKNDLSSTGEIEIYNIAVEKNARRQSIASALLSKVVEVGTELGVEKIFLEVRKSNISAQKFYQKHFFEIAGVRKNFYANPPDDAFLMCLTVKSI